MYTGNHSVRFGDSSFKIKGIYGGSWTYQEISNLELVDRLPEIQGKAFGISDRVISQGHYTFNTYQYKKGILNVYNDSPPFILIEIEGGKAVFINSNKEEITKKWFSLLEEKTKLR